MQSFKTCYDFLTGKSHLTLVVRVKCVYLTRCESSIINETCTMLGQTGGGYYRFSYLKTSKKNLFFSSAQKAEYLIFLSFRNQQLLCGHD